jgi:hypothetical protein
MKAVWIILAAAVLSFGSPLAAQSNGQKPSQTAPNEAGVPRPSHSSGGAANSAAASNATSLPGRYQIVFNPNVRADTFLLDTQTGKIWHFVQYTDVVGEPRVWEFMPRLDDQSQFMLWLGTQALKPAQKTP